MSHTTIGEDTSLPVDPEQGAIKIGMTGSASGKALLRPHIYSSQTKKRLENASKTRLTRCAW